MLPWKIGPRTFPAMSSTPSNPLKTKEFILKKSTFLCATEVLQHTGWNAHQAGGKDSAILSEKVAHVLIGPAMKQMPQVQTLDLCILWVNDMEM